MRIAMIGTRGVGSNYGGIERCLDELCPRLVAMGHSVDVYSKAPAPYALPAGLRALPMPAWGGKHFENITRSALATVRAIGRYDIVHFHATGPGILSCLTRLAGQPSVVTVHALDQRREKWGFLARQALHYAERSAMLFADELTVVSEHLRRYVREKYDKVAHCLPNGMPAKSPRPAGAWLARSGLSPRGYFLFASRLTPEKGCHDLIAAFNRTKGPLKLAIAGGNGPAHYLRELQDMADPTRTVFLGHLRGDDLAEAFSNAHAYVLPSYIEGMSIALLEAIAYGLPVLVSDIAENRLVVANPLSQFAVGDVESLRTALESCAGEDPAASPRRVSSARFQTWDDIASRYADMYDHLLAARMDVAVAGT